MHPLRDGDQLAQQRALACRSCRDPPATARDEAWRAGSMRRQRLRSCRAPWPPFARNPRNSLPCAPPRSGSYVVVPLQEPGHQLDHAGEQRRQTFGRPALVVLALLVIGRRSPGRATRGTHRRKRSGRAQQGRWTRGPGPRGRCRCHQLLRQAAARRPRATSPATQVGCPPVGDL